MTAAIFATVFCWPLGIPAILNASRANKEAAAGQLAEAHRAAKRAKNWIIASFVVAGSIFVVAILAAISVPIYVEYVKSARASDAKTTINAIWQAAQVYYQDKGDWPATVEELETQKYLEISEASRLQWTFSITGAPPVTITAVSTEQMPGGAGHQVTYNIQDGSWNGYGLPRDEGSGGGD